ncbi:MAG: fructose-6-phosphate aldolase [Chloroflexi bacterium]|nr:fructose-6-phosphate aldolase [Chloroflexota bacterium]
MQLYLDTGDIQEVEEALAMGVLAGVTTNPTLLTTRGPVDFRDTIQRFCAIVPGPVSAEVLATSHAEMLVEALEIGRWAPNVVVKLPMTVDGLKTLHALREREANISTNVTLVFSPNQALLAARAGATYVSPFVGRLDDISHDGMAVVRDSVQIFDQHGIPTQVLAASVRHPLHCIEAAKAGAHIATMPFRVLMQMVKHPLTDLGLDRFIADWVKSMGEQGVVTPVAGTVR